MRNKLLLLVTTVLALCVVDRIVFSWFIDAGAIWRSDPELGYEHRPGVVSSWGERYAGKEIRINSYGHHDDEFPETKPVGELRAVVIGDSIVMGHGVQAAETFTNQLETLLGGTFPDKTFQMINAGVQGYATRQYLEVMKRARRFSPDFVVVGFCMNDVTEPLVLADRHGDPILDYHLIVQNSSPWVDVLLNDTGVGRIASWIRQYLSREELAERWRRYGVDRMIEGSVNDPEMLQAWQTVLADLDEIYSLARRDGIDVVLLIFPEAYQLGRRHLQEPQRILMRHARSRGVPYLDMTEVEERFLASGGVIQEILLDSNHYTARGHAMIARELLAFLLESGIVR